MNLKQLNQKFAFENKESSLQVKEGKGGIPVIEIKNRQASAIISLQGVHLLSWIPQGKKEVMWLSADAQYARGKSIRGGIPVCWPWFGASEINAVYPAHGFARTVIWQLCKTKQLTVDETQVTFRLETQKISGDKNIQKMWPYNTILEYTVTIGKKLCLELTTYNNSAETINISEALHTYFNVDDVSESSVYGLEGKIYLDKPDKFKRKKQIGPITINEEVDRVYLHTVDDVVIENKNRKIIIKKRGSQSTIVWNPWKETAEKMADLGKEGYLKMLCVESANAVKNTVRINAGDSHTLQVEYTVY